MDQYINKIFEFYSKLDKDTLDEIERISTKKEYKKGELLLVPEKICKYNIVINKGIARKYYLNNGNEITTALYFENDVAISLDSYLRQEPCNDYIEALTDITTTQIYYETFKASQIKFPELRKIESMFIECIAVGYEKRIFEFQTMSAAERYVNILNLHAKNFQNIPLSIIASYLGISTEMLSRIRKKI